MTRLFHTYALYSDDNSKLNWKLEEAVHGMSYEASGKPFQIKGDGRGTFRSLVARHC